MANWIEQLDAQIAAVLADWSILTTLIAITIAALALYPIFYPNEPDTHPLLLARQSTAAPVRHKNESATYRSPEVPHGYPLRTGLNVKDAGAPRWATGHDGDLRDIWREVLRGGSTGSDGKEVPAGLIMTVLGRDEVVEHDVVQLSKEIQILGSHMKASGCKKVAIYQPNGVEFLLTIFACSFYGLSPVLIPYNLPHAKVFELLNATEADGLVSAAGSIPLEDAAKACQKLRHLTWVVEKTSRHMDWDGVPDFAAGRLSVSVWHDLVEQNLSRTSGELPTNETGDIPTDLISVWQPKSPDVKAEVVKFTQANMVAAISAIFTTLPLRQRFSSADLVLPASSFSINYVLCQTMAALFSHASLAITSVAEPGVDLALATRSVSPTVIVASAETMANLHTKETAGISSVAQKVAKYSQAQAMSAGRMPTDGIWFKFLAPSSSAAGNRPGKLRLILTSERIGCSTPPLTSAMLSDLRIFTRARICYALTAARVAGAVSQTNVFDYRREGGIAHSQFGVPLSAVEIKVTNADDSKLGITQPEGEIVVSGPAVSGDEAKLGVRGRLREDGTLALA